MSCVCGDHLHRCKTSFCLVDGFGLYLLEFELYLQGAPGAWIGQVPTKTPIQCLWYHGWSPWRTCQFFIFVNGDRLSQVPACRLFPISILDFAASKPSLELRCQQVSIHCTVFAIWTTADFVRWNSCFLQRQRKNSSTLVFLPSHPILSSQTLGDCLCTPDAFHISNSIRYFWASVSLIPLSDKVVWALRGKPF